MNKEIKRILDNIDNEDCYYIGNQGCEYQDLDKRELKLIKNYIDDLQQRKDKAIEYIINELFNGEEELEWQKNNWGCISGSDLPSEYIIKLLDILEGKE